MKRCPTCAKTYPNDANFCPLDATRLAEVAGDVPAATTAAPDAGLIGGRYQLGERLGGSVTGDVYRARDAQSGAEVAIKIVAPSVYPTPLALERAQRELKQLSKLTSPRVVRVLDQGRHGQSQLWIAMELCVGRPLSAIVAEGGPLPVDRASRIVAEVGEALIEAQKVGVVHRDVAPKNVLIEPSGAVRVTNFGVPVAVSDRIAGVPEFMSPEQAEGKPVDQRSNIYSLGALYHYLLLGEPPFAGDPSSVIRQHVSTAVTPPSQRRPGFSPDAEQAILKALEKSSSRRHLTLRQLLTDVERLAGAPGAIAMVAAINTPNKKTMAMGALVPPPGQVPSTTMPGFNRSEVQAALERELPVGPVSGAPSPAPAPQFAQAQQYLQGGAPLSAGPNVPTMQPGMPVSPMAPTIQPGLSLGQAPTAMAPAPQPQFAPQPHFAPPQSVPAYAAPAPQPPAPQPMAAPAPRPAPAPAPAAAPTPSAQHGAASPPSMSKGKGKKKKDGKFRETMWFKKGELDEQMAQQPPPKEGEEERPEDTRGIDERYADDGTLSAEDRKKHSLRTGATQMMPAIKVAPGGALPGEGMSATDIAKEFQTGRKWLWVVVAVGVVIAIAVTIFLVKN